jgi:hypothetical protein
VYNPLGVHTTVPLILQYVIASYQLHRCCLNSLACELNYIRSTVLISFKNVLANNNGSTSGSRRSPSRAAGPSFRPLAWVKTAEEARLSCAFPQAHKYPIVQVNPEPLGHLEHLGRAQMVQLAQMGRLSMGRRHM